MADLIDFIADDNIKHLCLPFCKQVALLLAIQGSYFMHMKKLF